MVKILDYILGSILIFLGLILVLNFFMNFFRIELLIDTFIVLSIGILIMTVGSYLIFDFLKKISLLIFGLILLSFGLLQLAHGFQNILKITTDLSDFTYVIELFFGGIYLLIGMVFLGCLILPMFIYGLSFLLSPLLTKMRKITTRNIIRNRRRTQNTFAMIAIGLAFLISIGTVLESLDAGVYPGAKLELGGDIQIGSIGNSYVYGYLNMSNEFFGIPHVSEVIPVHIDWISINYNDTYSKGIYLYIINTTEYAKLHSKETLLTFMGPMGITISQFIHLLDQENSTIIQYELSQETDIGLGDKANLSFGLSVELDVVGIFGRMPGLPFTSVDYWSSQAVIISWNTLFSLTGINSSTYDSLAGGRTVAYWLGIDNIYNDQEVISILKTQIYPKIGVTLTDWDIRTVKTRVEEYGGIINVVNSTLFNILLFALLISLIGLSINTFISVHQRRREIGILRSIGISKSQIIKMIFGETFIISIYGLIFGISTGILTGFLMISYFPFIYFLPAIFTIDYIGLTWIIMILFIFTLISAMIPAYLSTRINIIEAIRFRG